MLKAPKGKIYTNGNGVYGKLITIGDGFKADEFYLISEEKYKEMRKNELENVEE